MDLLFLLPLKQVLIKDYECILRQLYLTIIPRARMGSESMAHEAEGRMGY